MNNGEVALFIDFENIRYGLRRFNQEPMIPDLMDKARAYGTVVAAFAYADFNEHPEWIRRQMDIAGITVRDIPLKRSFYNNVERVKSVVDMHMAMDIVETALDRPRVRTFVLMAGDSDYIRVTTWLRNRFDRQVIISGVPGSISSDLVLAASKEDPITPQSNVNPARQEQIIAELVTMIHDRQPPLGFWTIRLILDWARDRRNNIHANDVEASQTITKMVADGILLRTIEEREGRELTIASLDYQHPTVITTLNNSIGTDVNTDLVPFK